MYGQALGLFLNKEMSKKSFRGSDRERERKIIIKIIIHKGPKR
jgi:hypothetical protein